MAKRPITIQLEPDLIEAIGRAAKHLDVSRQEWIAAACRGALVPGPSAESLRQADEMIRNPAPYRQHVPGPNVENVRSSAQAKRDAGPYPKQGKR